MTKATYAEVAEAIGGRVIAENTIVVDCGYVYLGIKHWKVVTNGRVRAFGSWSDDAATLAAAYRATLTGGEAA